MCVEKFITVTYCHRQIEWCHRPWRCTDPLDVSKFVKLRWILWSHSICCCSSCSCGGRIWEELIHSWWRRWTGGIVCQHYDTKTTGHWYHHLQPQCGNARWQCRYYMQLNALIFNFCTVKFAGMLHTIEHAFIVMLSYTYILPSHTTCIYIFAHT